MTLVILFAVVIIAVIAAVVLVQSPAGSDAASSPRTTVTQSAVQPALQSAQQPVVQSGQQSPQKPVDFDIQAGSTEKCGLTCRQLSPSVTNTGTDTAHNVCISIVLHNGGGDLILLNGAPSLKKCIGNIAGGESKSEPIVIEADCGFLASKCIKQTLVLQTEATCDETTVKFPDQIFEV